MGRRKTFWIALVFMFLIIGILKGVLRLPDDVFWKAYVCVAAVVVLGAVAVNVCWYGRFMKEIKALMPLLETDPNRFIAEQERRLAGRKSPMIRATLCINICAGYCAKGEYAKAKESLLRLEEKEIGRLPAVVYWLDMAYVDFYLGENEEALSIVEAHKNSFLKYSGKMELGDTIAVVDIFASLSKGDKEGAEKLLTAAKVRWAGSRSGDDFAYLEKKLASMQ